MTCITHRPSHLFRRAAHPAPSSSIQLHAILLSRLIASTNTAPSLACTQPDVRLSCQKASAKARRGSGFRSRSIIHPTTTRESHFSKTRSSVQTEDSLEISLHRRLHFHSFRLSLPPQSISQSINLITSSLPPQVFPRSSRREKTECWGAVLPYRGTL